MRKLRILHRYLGLFFSPAILFFAFTGALQTFDLHSTNKSTGYAPPPWLVEMAQLHKKQTLEPNKAKAKPAKNDLVPTDSAIDKKAAPPSRSALPLKWFVVVMSVGLIATTFLGIVMAFRFEKAPWLILGSLAAGTLGPVAMIFF